MVGGVEVVLMMVVVVQDQNTGEGWRVAVFRSSKFQESKLQRMVKWTEIGEW
jgi:hypothetical protein